MKIHYIAGAVLVVSLAAAGCSQTSDGLPALALPTAPTAAASGGGGGTASEALTGAAIGGVVPQGQALADQSQFLAGGATTLTVSVRNVNLPDGTVLGV